LTKFRDSYRGERLSNLATEYLTKVEIFERVKHASLLHLIINNFEYNESQGLYNKTLWIRNLQERDRFHSKAVFPLAKVNMITPVKMLATATHVVLALAT